MEVVASIIRNQNNKLLLCQRNRNFQDSDIFPWEFPGGKVQAKETLESALFREITEELGTETVVREKIATLNGQLESQPLDNEKTSLLTIHFFVTTLQGSIKPQVHRAFAWFSLEELPPNVYLCPLDKELWESSQLLRWLKG